MKYIIALFLVSFFHDCHGQSSPGPQSIPALNATESILPGSLPAQSAAVQSEKWGIIKKSSPSNASAWFNYYLWTERDNEQSADQKKAKLASIAAEAATIISQSPQYYLIRFLESGKEDSISLFRALSMTEDKLWIYPYAVQFFIIHPDSKALMKYCTELNSLSPLPGNLYEYHYNVLMSADSGSTIYGKGLNDIVPMAILQQVYGIRKDIHLRYYTGRPREITNTYLCLSAGKESLAQYPRAIYTGLLIKLSGKNGIDELKRHVEKDFVLNYIDTASPATRDISQLYKNYLPCFILLYKSYAQSANPRAEKWKRYIQGIAEKAGIEESIKNLLEK